MRQLCGLLFTLLFAETLAEKKDCWYFEGDYPVYFMLLLIIGILCCCSTGYFIRRRVHPYPPPGEPDFNVAFTRYPIMPPGLHQTGFHSYGDSETAVISTVYPVQTHPRHMTAVYPVQTHPRHMTAVYPVQTHPRHMTAVYPVQTHPRHMTAVFSALPYSQPPPPPYDQAIQDSQKK